MELKSSEKASYNFFRLLRTIWERGETNRREIARLHGLDKATVSTIVSEFVASGVVRVTDLDTSTPGPGRRAEILEISDSWGFVAGMELRPDSVTSCATDMHGRVIASHRQRRHVDRKNLREALRRHLDLLRSDAGTMGRPLIGVGVGVGGIVRRDESVIVHSIPLGIHTPLDFNALASGLVSVPVLVDNDANCCAWREIVFDRAQAPKNSLFVLLEFRKGSASATYGGGVGLGLGFVLNGSVYYGETGSAGEFRSINWNPTFSSQFAIPDADVIDISEKPDALREMIGQLARHLALFVNTLNLKKVYIGGDAAVTGSQLVDATRAAIQANWPYDEPVDCVVSPATSDTETVAAGAAAMVLERIFEEPLLPSGLRDRNDIWTKILRGRTEGIAVV